MLNKNIPQPKTEAEHIARLRVIAELLKTATGEQRRLLLIEEGVTLDVISDHPDA